MKQKDDGTSAANELAKKKAKQRNQVTSNIPSVYEPGNAVSMSPGSMRTEPTKIKNSNPSKPSLGYKYTEVKGGKPGTYNNR